MEERLQSLFNECKDELYKIGINLDDEIVGQISIGFSKKNCKRYGCCKQEKPVYSTKYIEKVGRRRYLKYTRYSEHNIEISKWVMDLNTDIIKNTIIHEIIHCLPNCSNHGTDFKKYANYINYKLGYNIARLGNKKKDLKDSNIQVQSEKFNYKIECMSCGYSFYRKRLNCNFGRKYRCGKCAGKFQVLQGVFYEAM